MKTHFYRVVFFSFFHYFSIFGFFKGKEVFFYLEKIHIESLDFNGVLTNKYYGPVERKNEKPYFTLIITDSKSTNCYWLSQTNRNIFDLVAEGDTIVKKKGSVDFLIKSGNIYFEKINFFENNIDSLSFLFPKNTINKVYTVSIEESCIQD